MTRSQVVRCIGFFLIGLGATLAAMNGGLALAGPVHPETLALIVIGVVSLIVGLVFVVDGTES